MDLNIRRAGVLLHPTSLPSGVLDDDVERWLQLLSETGFSVWQVLPLGEPQIGLSPYQCSSAFAMNPGLLPEVPALDDDDTGFQSFCRSNSYWLDDYVLFKVLKKHFKGAAWNQWPDDWRFRQPHAMQQTAQLYEFAIASLKWQQYQLHKRWQEIKDKAAEKNILLFGDMPIFVAHDSADVWAHPEWFMLDEAGNMKVVAGVPPDYFSETGQRWGNPHYDWDAMHETGYTWWISRIEYHLEQFDLLRIDHFRGLESSWMIDASCETAVDGRWEAVPGDELLSRLLNGYEQLPLVAEDLGIITPEVVELRKKYGLPGMSILQFGFDEFEDSPHKPYNVTEDTVVYTGTHDNDTTSGWFESLDDKVKEHVLRKLELIHNGDVNWRDLPDIADRVVDAMVDKVMAARASICILPMQDWLHLGSEARMNTPGTVEGNWYWRFEWQQMKTGYVDKMRTCISDSQRLVN